jgi:hypothetical protein
LSDINILTYPRSYAETYIGSRCPKGLDREEGCKSPADPPLYAKTKGNMPLTIRVGKAPGGRIASQKTCLISVLATPDGKGRVRLLSDFEYGKSA